MFRKFVIDINVDSNSFDELSKSTSFEDICKGRKGAVLVNYKNELIPIMRTTTISIAHHINSIFTTNFTNYSIIRFYNTFT